MMSSLTEDDIKKGIQIFLNPEAGTLSHGRPIYAHEASDSGLIIDSLDVKSDSWHAIYKLYTRIEHYVTHHACKAVESREDSFHVSIS